MYWSLPTSARKTLVKFAQLLASGLPGNLLGEGIGGVKSGRRERRCHSGCSVKYVGRKHQSEFVHRQLPRLQTTHRPE